MKGGHEMRVSKTSSSETKKYVLLIEVTGTRETYCSINFHGEIIAK